MNRVMHRLKNSLFILWIVWLYSCNNVPQTNQHAVAYETNPETGAISRLEITNDGRDMNWMVNTDRSQYAWITEKYGWGLGYFTETINGTSTQREWCQPTGIEKGDKTTYLAGDVQIEVKRSIHKGDLIEEYTFSNQGKQTVILSDIGIYTPFNDNYPSAEICLSARAHVHIWDGENATYINATHMGSKSPHMGLILTQGSVKSYDIWERSKEKSNSHTRGIIALNPVDMKLTPGQTYTLSWELFSHTGWEDFYAQILKRGNIVARCNQYTFEKGDTARLELLGSDKLLRNSTISMDGAPLTIRKEGATWVAKTVMERKGEVRFDIHYGKDQRTHVDCIVFDNYNQLINNRVNFIIDHQQMNNKSDLRDGAYMVYDNETNRIYLNDTPNVNPVDRDEGAERIGMGVLLAQQYLRAPDDKLKQSLIRYAKFIREQLQDETYRTWSSVDKQNRNRAYNYVWIAYFYFEMYHVTGNKQYLTDGYLTLKSLYSQFGHGFYAIATPVCLGLRSLKSAGMTEEYESLREDFIKLGDTYVANGLNYPRHEVNYEQSIVAPALIVLTQLYLETGMQKYLDEAERQIPILEAFGGFQPSYHLNDISIRHWDGYWFGKHEMWGDTFPHYWSTLTGVVYYYYYQCYQDGKLQPELHTDYEKRAKNIVRNNLCLFTEDGRGSCAYMYPYRVNGEKAGFYDPYANDQDWAMVFYLLVNEGL